MRSVVRRSAFGASLAILAACGGDASTGVRASVVGTYQLSAVNGQGLPYTEQSSGAVVKLTGGQLVTRTDGSFTETLTRSTTSATGTSTASAVANGTYAVGNQLISFTYSASGVTVLGSLTSAGVSIQNGSGTYDYARQ